MRGHIVQRSKRKNSWSIVLSLGHDPVTGRRRQRWVTVRGKKKDAEKRLAALIQQVDTGILMDHSKETVSEFIARWLRDHVASTTRPRTGQFYAQINRLYIEPVIGNVPIQKLTASDVQRVIATVLDKGLSPTTARRAYATLHRALECALKWEVVYRNVCDAIVAPREAERTINPPDKATVKALLAKARETPHGAALWLLAYTGIRRGEVCAITRDRLDLDAGTLSIAGAVGRENGCLTLICS